MQLYPHLLLRHKYLQVAATRAVGPNGPLSARVAVFLPGTERAFYGGFGASLKGQCGRFQFTEDKEFAGAQGAAGLVFVLASMDASAAPPAL